MKISEIYAAIAKGNLLDKDAGYLTMVAIELLARVEGVPVPELNLTAPRFALSYPFDKRDLRGYWHGATHYQAWRRLILDAQMQAAPGDVDGAPWSSLARSERLGFNSSGGTFYDLPKHLTATMLPTDVTDAVITATYEGLDDTNRPRFRAGVNAFRRLFGNDLVQRTGLLPLIKPQPLPGLQDHRFRVPMSPEIEKARAKLFSTSTRVMLDYLHRLAVAGGRLNGKSDTLEDLRKALSDLPNPIDAEVPEITDQSLRGYINIVMRRIGGRDYRLTETEQTWSDLRKAARAAGCETSFLWALGKPATAWGLCPREISETVALDIIRSYQDSSMRSQSRRGCEQFDALRGKVVSNLLPPAPLGIRRRSPPPRKSKPVSTPDPVQTAWAEFYAHLRGCGWERKQLGDLSYLRRRASTAGIAPQDLSQSFIDAVQRDITEAADRTRLRAAVLEITKLSKDPAFSHLPVLSPPEDHRSTHGGPNPKAQAELEELMDFMNVARSTRRSLRVAVGVLTDSMGRPDIPLREVLEADMSVYDLGLHEPRRKIHTAKIRNLREFIELPWTPAWRELQKTVVKTGMTAKNNPVPKVLSWNPGTDPNGLTRRWAQRLARHFRSTLTNPPHGRADIARTLARHLAAFDALHDIPAVAGSGLLPPRIGPIR